MTPERVCEHCRRSPPVLIEMAPGKDKLPWFFCRRCYFEGLREPAAAEAAPATAAPRAPGKRRA